LAVNRLAELTRKVDAFFERVAARHGDDMQCATGCSDCCHVQLTITGVEAAAIRAHVAAWPDERRRDLTTPGEPGHCRALDPAGRCRIYEARPLVCRSHGVPIRVRERGLPVVQACHRNFTRTAPDPDCVLDQATLSATLFAVDAVHAPGPRQGDDAGPTRVELAGLLAELAIC
jgi:hypothetical protein